MSELHDFMAAELLAEVKDDPISVDCFDCVRNTTKKRIKVGHRIWLCDNAYRAKTFPILEICDNKYIVITPMFKDEIHE